MTIKPKSIYKQRICKKTEALLELCYKIKKYSKITLVLQQLVFLYK